jgi:UDP-N-acetylmuramoyl-tripeptide--D-alanyl-D-alanine ligase
MSLKLSIPGYHNIYNAMLASAISMEMGVKEKHIKESIEETLGEDMRMKIMNLNGKYVINDCYNANPVSLKSAIDTLKTISDSRKARSVAIIGDMFELGAHSDKYHEDIGRYLSDKNVNVVISLGSKSRKIYECFKNDDTKHISHHFNDKASLIESIKDVLKEGDVVLIKGSRGNSMEDIIKHI